MHISLSGVIDSNRIEVTNNTMNTSIFKVNEGTATEFEVESGVINAKNAVFKATMAENIEGNVYLTAVNKIVVDNSTFEAEKTTTFQANNKVSIHGSDIKARNLQLISQNGDVAFDKATSEDYNTIQAKGNMTIHAGKRASVQNASTIDVTGDVFITAGDDAQIVNSNVTKASSVNINGKNVWLHDANVKATNNITANATVGDVAVTGDTSLNANRINLTASNNIANAKYDEVNNRWLTGKINLNNKKTYLRAGNDIAVALEGVSNKNNGLYAKAGNNLAIHANELAVSDLIQGSATGKLTLDANKVIAGNSETNRGSLANYDSASDGYTAYIEVNGQPATGFVSKQGYTVDKSYNRGADGYNNYHDIQYASGEKVFLNWKIADAVTPPPAPAPEVETIAMDNDQSQMLNKLPRQPETYSNVTNISDGRTQFVDVFAAASQIEIEEDEE